MIEEREGSEYAHYKGFSVEYRDASHKYWIVTGDARSQVTSVTGGLKVLDKPALISWAERQGIEGALRLERAGELEGVPVEEAINLVRLHRVGADAKRDAGADRGTAVHQALRTYCEIGTPPKITDFEPQVRGYVQALCRWLLLMEPTPILVERIVGSPTHGFAGRFDLLAEIDGRLILVDLKTSNRVYAEHHLQMAGYELALRECGYETDGSVVVCVGENGGFVADRGLATADDYLAVLACHQALRSLRRTIKDAEHVTEAVA